MHNKRIIAAAGLVLGLGMLLCINSGHLRAQGSMQISPTEYAVIQWDGRENTRFIRPNGHVEKLKSVLEAAGRPEGVHDKSYYLAIALNAVAREGFEFAGSINDDLIVKRTGVR